MIIAEAEILTRGRIFGPTLQRRLRTSTETILKCAEWNVRCPAALEQACLDEQEKLARWEQDKGSDRPADYPTALISSHYAACHPRVTSDDRLKVSGESTLAQATFLRHVLRRE